MRKIKYLAALCAALLALSCGVELPEDDAPVDATGTASSKEAMTNSHGQGSRYQGSRYQGSRYQGSRYQGSRYQGATYGGTSLSSTTSLTGTALSVWTWKQQGATWEQRFPNKICYWNRKKTQLQGCSTVNLAISPSPLVGVSWQTQLFDDATGTTLNATVRIDRVEQDTELAMFAGGGAGSCPLVTDPAQCDNPAGCRKNCDVWLYTATLVDSTGATESFCPEGGQATAIKGVWGATGTFADSATEFTFACTAGTIAKCARWGYKPWVSAVKPSAPLSAPISLKNHHLACTRAATADYCGNGNSFTRDGTLVDVFDPDFVPRTRGGTMGYWTATAYAWEAYFDRNGALCLDQQRYAETGSVFSTGGGGITDPITGCAGRWEYPILSVPPPCEGMSSAQMLRKSAYGGLTAADGVMIGIDMTTGCSHNERQRGKWLHQACAPCAGQVGRSSTWNSTTGYTYYNYCVTPSDPRGWDDACVAQANSICAPSSFSASHKECLAGSSLPKASTGCSLAVCLDPATSYCCKASDPRGWDAACTLAANNQCSGGQEGRGCILWGPITLAGRRCLQYGPVGFCGNPLLAP